MIISRTPVRVSLLGGGSDYPQWYEKHGGLCLGGAINKYSLISARRLPPYHPHKTRVVYSEIETVRDNREVRHRAVKAVLELLEMAGEDSPGLEITHVGDLPGKSGTGSSSAFVVGLIHALSVLKEEYLFPIDLARQAIHVEQEMLGEVVGCQDQVFAAFGGLDQVRFERDGSIHVYPVPLSGQDVTDLESHLALYYTGLERTASEVSSKYAHRLATDERYQWAMIHLAELGIDALNRKNWYDLGRLLDRAWAIKRDLAGVTSERIDRVYNFGVMAGAVGGKLIGAGGGGCFLFVLPEPSTAIAIDRVMQEEGLIRVPFHFDFQGSRVIFADREGNG